MKAEDFYYKNLFEFYKEYKHDDASIDRLIKFMQNIKDYDAIIKAMEEYRTETLCKSCKHYKQHLPQHGGDCLIHQKLLIFDFDNKVETVVIKCEKYGKS